MPKCYANIDFCSYNFYDIFYTKNRGLVNGCCHETATMKAVERVQFYVRQINNDAFMKCSDIAQAITDITKP